MSKNDDIRALQIEFPNQGMLRCIGALQRANGNMDQARGELRTLESLTMSQLIEMSISKLEAQRKEAEKIAHLQVAVDRQRELIDSLRQDVEKAKQSVVADPEKRLSLDPVTAAWVVDYIAQAMEYEYDRHTDNVISAHKTWQDYTKARSPKQYAMYVTLREALDSLPE